jgi:hypothetical protein
MSSIMRLFFRKKTAARNRVIAGPKKGGNTNNKKGRNMKIHVLTTITALALPLMALGQTEPQQTTTQGQTNETQTTAPTKGKKMRPAQEQEATNPQAKPAKPETGTKMRGQTNVQGRQDVNKTETGVRAGTSQTNVTGTTNQTTTVNKQEFRTRHSEVFSLGRHPKEFFVQRFGTNHVRLIGNTYFAFVDGCWVSVDVDGFVYSERVICQGDPDFVVIE